MEPLAYERMDFEEFCAAAISVYQLEAVAGWESIATRAFEYFEQEGNRVISVHELVQVSNHSMLGITTFYTINNGELKCKFKMCSGNESGSCSSFFSPELDKKL